MVARWREGFDVVFATRSERIRRKSWAEAADGRRLLPPDGTAFGSHPAQHRRLPPDESPRSGCLAVPEGAQPLHEGDLRLGRFPPKPAVPTAASRATPAEAKWNWWSLTRLAVEGITSFSSAPLQLATWIGLAVSALAFAYAVHLVVVASCAGRTCPATRRCWS